MARFQLVSALLFCCCLAVARGEDFTDAFNVTLQGFLDNLWDPIRIPITLPAIPLHIPGLAELNVTLSRVIISGQSMMRAEDCTYNETTTVVEMSLVLPYDAITCKSLNMTGVLLDNIFINGEGPASFVLDNLRITIRGNTSTNSWDGPVPILVFDDATLELVLDQWTVEMEDLTPGSDLGTLMNSFFSGLGPDIFVVLADLINQTDLVLRILNSFFPPSPLEEISDSLVSEKAPELIVNDVVQLLSKYWQE